MAIPERSMIVVAVLLAILEKFTSMLGKLNCIWATTVLLGGFAKDLGKEDFLCVSVISVVEGIRIFSRKGELQTNYSSLDRLVKLYSFIIEEFTAEIFCLVSVYRLNAVYGSAWNQSVALRIFYGVSVVESYLIVFGLIFRAHSGIFLTGPMPPISQGNPPITQGKPPIFSWISRWVGKPPIFSWISRWVCEVKEGFWRARSRIRWFCPGMWKKRWLLEMKEGYNLDDSQLGTLGCFLHDILCRCIYGSIFDICGSIFDSSKITIVSYSVELLQSSDGHKQLMGARLLSGLVKDNPRALERLRSIGPIRGAVEMLVDMLNWDWDKFAKLGLERIGIREAAAEIISNLVKIGRNRTLVMATPNSMESIASVLDDGNRNQSSPDSNLSKVGLCILNQLAKDHDNRAKMGSNRGLLLKIITLTESNSSELHLKMLAIKTLTSIARDQDFREIIGCIDGVLHNLFSLFLMKINIGNVELVRKAGKALGFLSLDNNQNCEIMLSIRRDYFRNLIPRLISLLNDQVRGTYAARILRNLSAYLQAYPEANSVELNIIREASAQVVELVMEKEGVHQEAAIGLAAQIFTFLSQSDYDLLFGEPEARSLISKLQDVLRQYASPSKELPNIRRFSIMLLIAVMRMDRRLKIRDDLQLQEDLMKALEGAMNTTSVLESYSTFSGTVGLMSHRMSIQFLAESAIELLHPRLIRRHRILYPVQIKL